MKLTVKQKYALMGKKLNIQFAFSKKYLYKNDLTLRKIDTVDFIKSFGSEVEGWICGFSTICEGKIFWNEECGSIFQITKRVPCIKVSRGIKGHIFNIPYSELERNGLI